MSIGWRADNRMVFHNGTTHHKSRLHSRERECLAASYVIVYFCKHECFRQFLPLVCPPLLMLVMPALLVSVDRQLKKNLGRAYTIGVASLRPRLQPGR